MPDDDGRHAGMPLDAKITVQEVRNLIDTGRALEREELRAKVAALPCAEIDDADPCAYVARADILALIDGGSE
jgi:hypothetical protein